MLIGTALNLGTIVHYLLYFLLFGLHYREEQIVDLLYWGANSINRF